MKAKLFTCICILSLVIGTAVWTAPTTYAAKGGAAKLTAPRSMPAAPSSNVPATTKVAPNASQKANATGQQATSQTNTKQQANTKQQTAQNQGQNQQTRSGSFFGSAMRNIGLLAGGMFLGSMLSSLFGWGGMGFMADMMGLLFNIILLFVVIRLIAWAWQKFRGSKRTSDEDEAYRKGYEAAMRKQQNAPYTIDVTPLSKETKEDHK